MKKKNEKRTERERRKKNEFRLWDGISLGRIQNSNIDLETTDFVFDIIKVKN